MSEFIPGTRLEIYVAERAEITRSASQKWIEKGLVTVSGVVRDKNYRLREGDIVAIEEDEPIPLDAVAENIPLHIIYEDADLIIVEKPKGMVVHPAPGNYTGTLVNALLYHCGETLSSINGVIRPGIVHRLDKDTSGLLMVAKNDAAHVFLAAQLKEHHISRLYHAVVVGNLPHDSGTVDAPIGRHPIDRKKMTILPDGREAVTHYRVLERFAGFTYVELSLETGRTHQIRVHMASLGHPLLGDPVYGSCATLFEKQNAAILRGQCLHAKTLEFRHPSNGQLMHFDAGLPDYFHTILDRLRTRYGE